MKKYEVYKGSFYYKTINWCNNLVGSFDLLEEAQEFRETQIKESIHKVDGFHFDCRIWDVENCKYVE